MEDESVNERHHSNCPIIGDYFHDEIDLEIIRLSQSMRPVSTLVEQLYE
jgi:hypothetical protein